MYTRILVPFDGSPASESALHFADRLPASNLRLLRVEARFQLEMPSTVTGMSAEWVDRYVGDLREELEAIAAEHRRDGREVEADLRFGDPSAQIIDASADCDLVVMGTHGRGAAGRAIFGSTADRVAREGTIPTLLVRGGEHPVGTVDPARVVLLLDGSELAESAVADAQRLAEALAVPIHLARAVGLDEVRDWMRRHRRGEATTDDDTFEHARQEAVGEADAYLADVETRFQGMAVSTQVVGGTPAFELLALLMPEDVVVMSSHGRSGFGRWMIGSVAEKLVREAPAPVLLTHPTPPAKASRQT